MANAQVTAAIGQFQRWANRHAGGRSDAELVERFAGSKNEAAFEAILHRYGPLVLGVCRRVLHDPNDVEDAFQATFLVFLRKADRIRRRESIGCWLHGVAFRVAQRACLQKKKSHPLAEIAQPAVNNSDFADLRPIIDEEIARLPEKYRAPFILCHLQGKSRQEAAKQLGWKEGTLSGRLARARERLQGRLTRRGVTLGAGVFAAALAQSTANATVPMMLISATLKAVLPVASSTGILTATVAALTEGVLQTMLISKLKYAAVIVAAVGLLGTGAGIATHRMLATDEISKEKAAKPGPMAPKEERPKKTDAKQLQQGATAERARIQGLCTAADTGKPVAGAKIRVLIDGMPAKTVIAEAVSDADGKYAVHVPIGHCRIWGVYAPPGYYTQDPQTYRTILTTAAESHVVQDFVLQPGSSWQLRIEGVTVSADKPHYFSAYVNPERERFESGEMISVLGDAQGRAVLTIPTTGGKYRFDCQHQVSLNGYQIPSANLEIDKDFDPRRVTGRPELLVGRKGVRLRDAAGRLATVEGVEVLVEAGQAVLRFDAKRIAAALAIVFHGSVVDDAGKPIEGAKATAAFQSGNGGYMTHFDATTDAHGKFKLPELLMPPSAFNSDFRISMMVVKAGFDAAETKEIHLKETKQTGSGDFGQVVLKPGRTLRGKVVDENGKPVHGAVVTNSTNYFLYAHLRCRTDAEGRFVMPDLSWGNQKMTAKYGERNGEEDFKFDLQSGECVITVRSGPLPARFAPLPPARQPPTKSVSPPPPAPPAPDQVGSAVARIILQIADWLERHVQPATVEMPIDD